MTAHTTTTTVHTRETLELDELNLKLLGEVLVNDYAGHPFQIELSRTLAAFGYTVSHAYCNTNVTPRGSLEQTEEGPLIIGISTGDGFDKYNIAKRLVAEVRYGAKSVRLMRSERPSVCLNSNVPVVSLAMITLAARVMGIRNVLWLQDFQAGLVAMSAGEQHPAATIARRVENWCVRKADHVVAISDGFAREVETIREFGDAVSTIPNWAPIDDIPVVERNNQWAEAHDLVDRRVFLYSGTLGMKHRPAALVELAKRLAKVDPTAVVLIVSESSGVEWVESQRTATEPLENIRILPFQPFEDLPAVMGSAEVLIALLEEDAGEFSVPSKVLSYLCSGRPVLGLMPLENAAARLINDVASAGLVSGDIEGFLNAGEALARTPELGAGMGQRGRQYAETAFDVNVIAGQFLQYLQTEKETEKEKVTK